MLTRKCTICGRIIPQGSICPCLRDRTQEYNKQYKDQGRREIYDSKRWRSLTKVIAQHANNLDEVERAKGNIVFGRISHHIIPVSERPDLAFNPDNIIFVSDRTHSEIHRAYDQGEESKHKMQEKLFEIHQRTLRGDI